MGALKPVLITAGALLVLGAGLVVGDNFVRATAQQRVAAELQQQLGLAEPPTVVLGGAPFTPVLLSREVPTVQVTAVQVPVTVSGKPLTLDTVDVTAQGVSLSDGEVHVDSGRVAASIGYPAVSTLAGVPVTSGDEPGRLQVSYVAQVPVVGQVEAAVSAVPELSEGADQVMLTDAAISVASFELNDQLSQWLLDQVVKPIPLELPYGLQPETVEATSDGLVVAVSASDLTVPLAQP